MIRVNPKFNKVTISGLVCTGKSTLFAGLKEFLSWPSFSVSEFFRQYSREYKLSLEKAQEQDGKISKRVDFAVRKMLKLPGNLIIEGWMAGIMADDFPGVLRVLLTCADKERFDRFARREHLSFLKAKQKVEKRETNLFIKLRNIYKRDDIVEPKNYNFVLETTDLDPRAMLKRVLEKLGSEDGLRKT